MSAALYRQVFLWIVAASRDVHSFANGGTVRARMLTMIVPGGFEGYFKDMNAHGEDPAAREDINRRFDVQIVGPPVNP